MYMNPTRQVLISGRFVSLRWYLGQMYVSKVGCANVQMYGVKVNGKGGVTITIKKRGGWATAYNLAKKVAGWEKEETSQ